MSQTRSAALQKCNTDWKLVSLCSLSSSSLISSVFLQIKAVGCALASACTQTFSSSFCALFILRNAFFMTTACITLTCFSSCTNGSPYCFSPFLCPWVFFHLHIKIHKKKTETDILPFKKTTLHHVLSELLSTFYPCQISLSANSLPSLTFTVFNLDHLWLPPPPPSFSPTKADLFTFKNNTKNVLLWGLLLSFIESSFLFSLSALWLDENCKKINK